MMAEVTRTETPRQMARSGIATVEVTLAPEVVASVSSMPPPARWWRRFTPLRHRAEAARAICRWSIGAQTPPA